MKEKNGFFAKTENKVEILTKIFFGCNVLLDFQGSRKYRKNGLYRKRSDLRDEDITGVRWGTVLDGKELFFYTQNERKPVIKKQRKRREQYGKTDRNIDGGTEL